MFGNLFKSRSHYVFDYKPRYYNERKERLQKLEEQYHGKNEDTNEETSTLRLTKNSLKNDWVKSKRNATDRGANIRLALIITILVGIAAYILDIHTLL